MIAIFWVLLSGSPNHLHEVSLIILPLDLTEKRTLYFLISWRPKYTVSYWLKIIVIFLVISKMEEEAFDQK